MKELEQPVFRVCQWNTTECLSYLLSMACNRDWPKAQRWNAQFHLPATLELKWKEIWTLSWPFRFGNDSERRLNYLRGTDTPDRANICHTRAQEGVCFSFHDCRNKLPQTRVTYTKKKKKHCLPVLESRSPKSKCLKCWFLSEALRRMRILWPLRKNVLIPCFSTLLPAILEDPWPEDIKL